MGRAELGTVRGLVRKSSKKNQLPRDEQVVIGDVTLPDTLSRRLMASTQSYLPWLRRRAQGRSPLISATRPHG